MKLQFLRALLAPRRGALFRVPTADTVLFAAVARDVEHFRRVRRVCRWRRDPISGHLEARWSTRD